MFFMIKFEWSSVSLGCGAVLALVFGTNSSVCAYTGSVNDLELNVASLERKVAGVQQKIALLYEKNDEDKQSITELERKIRSVFPWWPDQAEQTEIGGPTILPVVMVVGGAFLLMFGLSVLARLLDT
jgi:hypothetical protein